MSPPRSTPKRSLSPPTLTSRQRSDFELEPNPFEQSFSGKGKDDEENTMDSQKPKNAGQDQPQPQNDVKTYPNGLDSPPPETPKPTLPPLSSLASPGDPWGFPNSLRSGPLSPAMLAGPQPLGGHSSHLGTHLPHHAFDHPPGTFRTGLTPGTGLTPLVAGPASFPPPSPNTAAFLAMVTNNAHASFGGSAATITPNTLNAITGVLNAASAAASNNAAPHHLTNGQANGAPQVFQAQSNYQSYGMQPPPTADGTTATASNGLFLLSQAQQEIEQQARAADTQPLANGNGSTNGNSNPRARNSKRKSTDTVASTSASNGAPVKKARNSSGRGKKDDPTPSLDSNEDGDDSGDDYDSFDIKSGKKGGSKKFETDDDKRKNFLERNRQAALKCRQRKKAWLANLQAKVEILTTENARLNEALISSREEITRLTALVGGAMPNGVSIGASLMNGPTNKTNLIAAQAAVTQGNAVGVRAYGY